MYTTRTKERNKMTDNEDNAKYNPPSQKKQKSKKAKLSNLRVDQLVKLRDHDLHALSMREHG